MITQGVTEMLFIFNGGGSDATLTGLTHTPGLWKPISTFPRCRYSARLSVLTGWFGMTVLKTVIVQRE